MEFMESVMEPLDEFFDDEGKFDHAKYLKGCIITIFNELLGDIENILKLRI